MKMIVKKNIISKLCRESFLQPGIPLLHNHVVDGISQSLGGSDNDADFLGPGDTRIDEIPLKHHVMGHQQGDDHHGIFRAL